MQATPDWDKQVRPLTSGESEPPGRRPPGQVPTNTRAPKFTPGLFGATGSAILWRVLPLGRIVVD